MPTNAQNLKTRRSAIIAELAALDGTKAGGKPDGPAGIRHIDYKRSLYEELEKINQQLGAAEGPYEVYGQATT